jgi:hypothetical protein
MDKITRIKRLVESSLDTSFGGDIHIVSLTILPTQKYDEETKEWVPDSHSIFLNLKDKRNNGNNPDYYHFVSDHPSYKVSTLLESLLGFECCVEFV